MRMVKSPLKLNSSLPKVHGVMGRKGDSLPFFRSQKTKDIQALLNVAALVFFKKSVSLGPRIRPSKRDRIGNLFFEKPYIPCLIWKAISIVELRKTQEDLVE